MKTKKLFPVCYLFVLLLFPGFSMAGILLVDGNLGGAGQYTQVSTAIAAAQPGDTLYVSGAGAYYSDFTIDKSIAIIGPGNFRQTQVQSRAQVENVFLAPGVGNVNFSGFWVNTMFKFNPGNSLISIQNNYINNLRWSDSVDHVFALNNLFGSFGTGGGPSSLTYIAQSHLVFEHCIFNGYFYPLQASNSYMDHCFFWKAGQAFGYNTANVDMTMMSISNTIFYQCDPTINIDVNSCVFTNCISYYPSITFGPMPGSGNLDNTNPQLMNFPVSGAAFSVLHDYHLSPSSPGYQSGSDGTDIGLYGGSIPATVTGEVYGLPVIRRMQVMNSSVPQNGNVNVKVRSTKPRENH